MNKATLLTLAGIGGLCLALAQRRRRTIDLAGRTVLITGARGLGLALARSVVQRGASVALVARERSEVDAAIHDLSRASARLLGLVGDMTDPLQAANAVQRAAQYFGRLDVLINNAGVIAVSPLQHVQSEDVLESVRIHMLSPYHTMRAAIPIMQSQGMGRIVNIASVGGIVSMPHLTAYCASKAGLVGLSDSIRAEVASSGIAVTTVCPGMMRTGSHVNASFKGNRDAEYTWFTVLNALPGVGMATDEAAEAIVQACERGQARLDLTVPTHLARIAQGVAPNAVASLTQLTARLLPKPVNHGTGDIAVPGGFAEQLVPDWLTRRSDRETAAYNE